LDLGRSASHALPRVDSDAIFVRDGAVVTSAGITASLDLTSALVEADHGPDLARQVAKHW
jgi:transcriptional regulator GlxA family with amidase domain